MIRMGLPAPDGSIAPGLVLPAAVAAAPREAGR